MRITELAATWEIGRFIMQTNYKDVDLKHSELVGKKIIYGELNRIFVTLLYTDRQSTNRNFYRPNAM